MKIKNIYTSIYKQSRYNQQFRHSIQHPEEFWKIQAQRIKWHKFPTKILNSSNPPYYKWYQDGQINITNICLDQHLSHIPNQIAFYYQSPITNSSSTITYQELHKRVSKFASALQKQFNIKQGDRIVIYMPMIIQSAIAMLACARIGAIHSVVFGGFSASQLGYRIKDTSAKLIITASGGKQPNKIIQYVPIVKEAIKISGLNLNTIVFRRDFINYKQTADTFDFKQLQDSGQIISPKILKSTDPLYILYTSGSTGAPKGVYRDHGGTAVGWKYATDVVLGLNRSEKIFCTADVGWGLGHNYVVYAPLISGLSSVLFQGKPVGTPDAGVIWNIIEKNNINLFYTSPSAIRALRRQDPFGKFINRNNLKSLHSLYLAGERCDITTYEWLQKYIQGIFLNDNYWQTQTGYPVLANFRNLQTFKFKAGSAGMAVPGYKVQIFDEKTKKIIQNQQTGLICIKEPTPPGFMLSLWNNDSAYPQKYFKQIPGYYLTGDAGYIDKQGYYYVMSRIDDVINTSGHRLSTGQMQQIIMTNDNIAQAIVIGIKDQQKGQIPAGFVTLKQNCNISQKQIQKQLIQLIRNKIGPVASFKSCLVIKRIPKTRSGKYLRHIIRKICNNQQYSVPSTIEDLGVIQQIKEEIIKYGLNKHTNIQFKQDKKAQK